MNVCRTCLAKEHLTLIFEDERLNNKRSDDLFSVTGVKICFNDGLPQLICVTCTNIINDSLKLRKQSLESETMLRNQEKKNKVKNLKKSTITISDLESSDSFESTYSPIRIKDLESDNECRKHEKKLTIDDLESNDSLNDSVSIDDNFQTDIEPLKMSPVHDLDLNKKTKIEKWYTIKDLESSDDDNLLNTIQMECEDKMRKKALIEAETRKCMALAVEPYDNNGPIKCRLCNKMLKNASIFKCHAKTHFEREFTCEICGKKFTFINILRYHQQRVHGKEKRLACTQCSYRAVDLKQLQNHTRAVHTGERPFVCDVCGDTFRMRNTIAQHMRKHFGVRNVQCERCPAMFKSGSELSWHRNKVHLMIYTFYCYLCPQTYKRLCSVKKHLFKVHGVPLGQHLPIKRSKERR